MSDPVAPKKMRFLLTMVETDIAREGESASFMVRAGLLRDILLFAIAKAESEQSA
jgi:hypothetical protein